MVVFSTRPAKSPAISASSAFVSLILPSSSSMPSISAALPLSASLRLSPEMFFPLKYSVTALRFASFASRSAIPFLVASWAAFSASYFSLNPFPAFSCSVASASFFSTSGSLSACSLSLSRSAFSPSTVSVWAVIISSIFSGSIPSAERNFLVSAIGHFSFSFGMVLYSAEYLF